MSHFTVLIIGESPEKQLVPYQEDVSNLDTKYISFKDMEEEYRKEWENNEQTIKSWYPKVSETIEKELYDKIVNNEEYRIKKFHAVGTPLNIGTRLLFRYGDKELYAEISVTSKERSKGQGYDITVQKIDAPIETKIQDYYKDFENYVKEYHGYDKRDEEKGRYGYWYNPNAKWDWYSLGGRWTGFFKLKEGASGKVGTPGLMTNKADSGYADQTLKKNIDIEFMENAAVEKNLDKYDKAQKIIKGEEFKTWDEILKIEDMKIEEKRELYHAQSVIKRFSNSSVFGPFDDIDKYTGSREKFIDKVRAETLQTFAVLKDGKWYKKGEVGWWGVVHNEKDEDVWNKEFKKLIDEISEDTLLSVYDCHI